MDELFVGRALEIYHSQARFTPSEFDLV